MKLRKICEIVDKFKRFCRSKGWNASTSGDWIKLDNDYHNFLWTRNVSRSSFEAIVSHRECVIKQGLSYSVAKPCHTAWLFSEEPSGDLLRIILKNPDYSRSVAIYDLSPVTHGKKVCTKLNKTDSPVFQEFETFLQTELKITVNPHSPS